MATVKDLEEKRAQEAQTQKPDPLEQDARAELRKDPKYLQIERENRTLKRQLDNLTDLIEQNKIPDKKKTPANNGGPTETGWGNVGGLASAKYVQHAVRKYLSGEWTEADIERYFFHDAGWLEKGGQRAKQIVKMFSKNQTPSDSRKHRRGGKKP